MTDDRSIADHYSQGDLLARLSAALVEDGADPQKPSQQALAPYDHFHGRGLEATADMADQLRVTPADHLLDVGSGIGGPARYMANRFGCRVTGIDLTAAFCDVARHLNTVLRLEDLVAIEQGDAVAMPFADASFDGAYSMNVSMNIADKAGLYRALARVLKPGGWLVLSEMTKGPGEALAYPTPWAKTAATSFLTTEDEILDGLTAAGFVVTARRDLTQEAEEYGKRSRAVVEQGGKPLHRAVRLIHGDLAEAASANTGQGLKERRILPVEITCAKPRAS